MIEPRAIIARAWAITKKERPLRRWGYASAVLETLLNVKLLIYQVWFLISYLQGNPIGFFAIEEILLEHLPFWFFVTLMVTFLILLVVELLFPHLAAGAIIGLAAKSEKGEEVKGGLILGMYNFFPIFAIHEFFMFANASFCITLISLLLRYAGGMAPIGITMLIIAFVVSNFLRFMFIFAEEAVVIHKKSITSAMGTSFKLVLSYLSQVVFLLLLFFFITLRIILNALIIFLIPGVIIGFGMMLTWVMPPEASYTITTILAFVLIGFVSYLVAYIDVFGQTVWTLTYIELSKQRDLDVIEEE